MTATREGRADEVSSDRVAVAREPVFRRLRRRWFVPVVLGLLAAGALSVLADSTLGEQVEAWSYDWRVAMRHTRLVDFMQAPSHARSSDVIVVPIDESTLDRLPEPMVFWVPYYASVLDSLVRGGAAVVGVDYMFKVSPDDLLEQHAVAALDRLVRDRKLDLDPSSIAPFLARDDLRLFEVLRGHRIVLMSFLREDGTLERGAARFAWAAGADNHGLVNRDPDRDDVVRRISLYRTAQAQGREEVVLSFALVVASRLTGHPVTAANGRLQLGETSIPHDDHHRLLISFAGPPGTFVSPFSFADLVERSRTGDDRFFRSMFAGKAVLIGPCFTGSGDVVQTPYRVSVPLEMFGVEVHANVVNAIASGDYIRRVGGWPSRAALATTALISALLCFYLRPVGAVVAMGGVAAALGAGATVLLYRCNLWFELAAPLGSVPLSFALVYAFRYVSEERERSHIRVLLGRYVSEAVAESLLGGSASLALGGSQSDVSILFCDINGFTTLSERSTPEDVIELLNNYFTRMEQVIFRHGGTLKQFVGDEIMVICGAPKPDPDHPVTACRLALDMVRELREWQRERRDAGLEAFEVKFGLHCGDVVVGNVGSPHRSEYAAVGDVVNTAARIMGLTREAGTNLLISDAMHRRAGDRFETRSCGTFAAKGKAGELEVFELVGER